MPSLARDQAADGLRPVETFIGAPLARSALAWRSLPSQTCARFANRPAGRKFVSILLPTWMCKTERIVIFPDFRHARTCVTKLPSLLSLAARVSTNEQMHSSVGARLTPETDNPGKFFDSLPSA